MLAFCGSLFQEHNCFNSSFNTDKNLCFELDVASGCPKVLLSQNPYVEFLPVSPSHPASLDTWTMLRFTVELTSVEGWSSIQIRNVEGFPLSPAQQIRH